MCLPPPTSAQLLVKAANKFQVSAGNPKPPEFHTKAGSNEGAHLCFEPFGSALSPAEKTEALQAACAVSSPRPTRSHARGRVTLNPLAGLCAASREQPERTPPAGPH